MSKAAPNVNRANKYARDVLAGRVLAGEWVQLACERHIDDLDRADWHYVFDRQKAERACKFIQLLPHTKGKWARSKDCIKLEPWQCFVVASIFGWVERDTGRRRFREAYLEIARKNGKSI